MRCLCLLLALVLCAARLGLLVCALVWFSVVLVLVVALLPLLVRGCVGRCVWLLLSGLPLAAAAAPVLVVLFLLSLWRPCLLWPRPLFLPLLVWLLSFSRRPRAAPLPSARCALLPRARVGPSASRQGGRQTLPVVLSMFSVKLSCWRR